MCFPLHTKSVSKSTIFDPLLCPTTSLLLCLRYTSFPIFRATHSPNTTASSSCPCRCPWRVFDIRYSDTEQTGSVSREQRVRLTSRRLYCNHMLAHAFRGCGSIVVAVDPGMHSDSTTCAVALGLRLTAVRLVRHGDGFLASGICVGWVSGPKSWLLPVSSGRCRSQGNREGRIVRWT